MMKADTEMDREALGQAPRDQFKRGRSDNMSKGVKTMMGTPTETADLSKWELTVLTAGEPA